VEDCWRLTKIDPWFLDNIHELVAFEGRLGELRARWVASGARPEAVSDYLNPEMLRDAKTLGVADALLARLFEVDEVAVRSLRREAGVHHTFKLVDTCGAEFEAYTPYLYSTYERECEAAPSERRKILILGSGPNRIGQGIEFDYCCVHGVFALKDDGFETIMVNCNPETVSTDYDTSDRLYFEPLTLEDVLNIIETERPEGVIVQFGGQTPLKLAIPLERAGVRIIGTSPEAIDRAEDRER
ncbi:carbamoyl phosphate synthase large subunit, partial [Nitrospinae bacterium AH_259_B05_G02_I21]|nr:carbamoyl phosphate synthase large subunit [Nitrospinae bacterium AH_259_B05_G02_I21]